MTHTATKSSRTRIARVLIVDDHPIVRDGLIAALSRQPDLQVCGEAASVAEALKLIDAKQPDLAIVDLSLPDGSGLDLVKRIKARDVPTKILVLSMSDESVYAERVLRAGALGFLNKQEAREKLVEALRRILADKIFVSPAMNERLLHQAMTGKQPLRQTPIKTLSDRELEVFELIGQGLRSNEIAKRLHLGVKTIQTHRQRIMGKLDLESSVALVHHATEWVLENR